MELTDAKRKELIARDIARCVKSRCYHQWRDDEIAALSELQIDMMLDVIAATSEPATIKPQVLPEGGVGYIRHGLGDMVTLTMWANGRSWWPADEVLPEVESRDAELAALRAKLAEAEKERAKWEANSHKHHDEAHEMAAELHKTRAKLTVAESSLAELRAAVNEFGTTIKPDPFEAHGYYAGPLPAKVSKTVVGACLAAWRAKKPEVTDA